MKTLKQIRESRIELDMSRMKDAEKKKLIDLIQSLNFKRQFKLTQASVSLGKYMHVKTGNIEIGKLKDELKKQGYKAINWTRRDKLEMEGVEIREALKNVYTVSVLFRDEKKAKAFSKDKNLLKLAKVTGIEKTKLRFNKIGWTVDLESEKNNIAQNPINKKIVSIQAKYETDVKEGDDSLGAKKFQNPLKQKKYPYQEQLNVMDSFRNMREALDLEEVKSILQKDIKGLKTISDIEIRFSDEKEWKRMSSLVQKELKKPDYKGLPKPYFVDDPLQMGFGDPKGKSDVNIKPIVDMVVKQTKDSQTRIKSLSEESWKAGEAKPKQSIQEAPVLPSTMTGGVQSDHSIEDGVKKYEDAINKQINSGEFAKMHKERGTKIVARKASKYYRVEEHEMGRAGSIHAFIEIETGDIFKPAGWKAPAKGARGNVTDQRYIDYVAKYPRAYHGGHLYK